MIQYFFCFLLSIGSFGYTGSIDECSCEEEIIVITGDEDDISGIDVIMN